MRNPFALRKLRTKNLYSLLLASLLFSVCNLTPDSTIAQEIKSDVPKTLEHFEGLYQLQVDENMSLKITVKNGHLLLKQVWDNLEIPFKQISELSFLTADGNFPLDFKRDEKGMITQVTAFKKDVWIKKKGLEGIEEVAMNAETVEKLRSAILVDFPLAINSGSAAEMEKFVKSNFDHSLLEKRSIREVIAPAIFLYRNTGGIDPVAGQIFKPNVGNVDFKGRSFGNVYSLTFVFSPDGKIRHYGFREQAPKDTEQKPLSKQGLKEQLQTKVEELSAKDLFSGTVLVAKNNEILFKYACGESNKTTHTKVNMDTKFNLGSMNKMFTATSIMQLAEKGMLSINDPLSKYLDESWLPAKLSSKITIHHLLSHTGGTGDFFSEAFDKTPRSSLQNLADYKRFIRRDSLLFEPGTSWDYSNAGMIFLGAIIEKVSGMNYFDYVNQHIYQPAGMKNSGRFEPSTYRGNLAIGYIPNADGGYDDDIKGNFTNASSAGGGYSTVGDLYKFARALTLNKLITQASLDKMSTDYIKRSYGYGLQLRNTAAGKIIGHSGGAPGVNSVEHIVPQSGVVVIVLANYDRAAQQLGDHILALAQRLK